MVSATSCDTRLSFFYFLGIIEDFSLRISFKNDMLYSSTTILDIFLKAWETFFHVTAIYVGILYIGGNSWLLLTRSL